MRVMKFGGTSVASAERLAHVASLVAAAAGTEDVVVVVSALAGVTDTLVELVERARAGRPLGDRLAALRRRHAVALAELGGTAADALAMHDILAELEGELARAAAPTLPAASRDAILAVGERVSLVLTAAACRRHGLDVVRWDTRRLVRTDSRFGEAAVDLATTTAAVRAARGRLADGSVVVATGFIGADAHGRTTTLGRGGSDYTASLLGAALGAARIEIWTDVDGVLSAPPYLAAFGSTIPRLDYDEAFDLARFGGKVLHPKTMAPAAAAGIPIVVRNTFAPEHPGTVVGPREPALPEAVQAVSLLDDVVLLRLAEGRVDEERLRRLGALPCSGPGAFPPLWVAPGAVATAVAAQPFEVRRGVTLVAVVGRALARGSAPAAALRAALRTARVPVLAAVDTGSCVSAAVVVPRGMRETAVRLLHDAFVAAPPAVAAADGR